MPIEDRILLAFALALVISGVSGFNSTVLVIVGAGLVVFLGVTVGPIRPEGERRDGVRELRR
jgi:hypothetical protein